MPEKFSSIKNAFTSINNRNYLPHQDILRVCISKGFPALYHSVYTDIGLIQKLINELVYLNGVPRNPIFFYATTTLTIGVRKRWGVNQIFLH
jgi:hypothetical protein